MILMIAIAAIAALIGLALLGHTLVLRALFTSADHADRKLAERTPRGFLPDVPL